MAIQTARTSAASAKFTEASHSFAIYVSADKKEFTLLSEGFLNSKTKNSVVKSFAESLPLGEDGELLMNGGLLKLVVRTMREKKQIDFSSFA